MPANYFTLSVGLVTKALTKKRLGSSLPNSVTPRNLFPISTRRTRPNLAHCQVFLKALISSVFHFSRMALIFFMFKDFIITILLSYCRVQIRSSHPGLHPLQTTGD